MSASATGTISRASIGLEESTDRETAFHVRPKVPVVRGTDTSRRQVLRTTAVGTAVIAAGCTSMFEFGDEDDTPTPPYRTIEIEIATMGGEGDGWELDGAISCVVVDVDAGGFEDVRIVAIDDEGETIREKPLGDVGDDGFERREEDASRITYRRSVQLTLPTGPRQLAVEVDRESCLDDVDERRSILTITGPASYDHEWLDCDESLDV